MSECNCSQRIADLEEEVERLAHGICDALHPGYPTMPILRGLLKGTAHEDHHSYDNSVCPTCNSQYKGQGYREVLDTPICRDKWHEN